ncbi:hypothetical protein ACJ73_00050, partial [Blastomyces percursus]
MAHSPANLSTAVLESQTAILDQVMPGFSFLSRIFSSYFHIDPFYLLLIVSFSFVAISTLPYLHYVTDCFTSTVNIRYDDDAYDYLLSWLSKQEFVNEAPHVVVKTKTRRDLSWFTSNDDDNDDNDDDTNSNNNHIPTDDKNFDFEKFWAETIDRNKSKQLRYTLAVGSHRFRYKGRRVGLRRVLDNRNVNSPVLMNAETLVLSCFGSDPAILKELLREAQEMFIKRHGNSLVIHRGVKDASGFRWKRCSLKQTRPPQTLLCEQKDTFIKDLTDFLHPNSRLWYQRQGIPYRRGYLFSGPPGTGKSSLYLVAASQLRLNIYWLNLNLKGLDDEGLISLFDHLPKHSLVLLEDVDSCGISLNRNGISKTTNPDMNDRRISKEAARVSFSTFLNVLDGIIAPESYIFGMTTNHPERLDQALIRPGRVDLHLEFNYADGKTIQGLFHSFYMSSNSYCKREQEIDTLSVQFAKHICECKAKVTPADVQGHLLQHKNSPEAALKNAGVLVQELNAHSMTLPVRGAVKLFRLVKREDSISHDHCFVRIYGHYPVIEGEKTTYCRHPIHKFDFTSLD